MLNLWNSWFGRYSRMLGLLLVLTFTLTSCGASPLSLLTGGGPNVAANTQLGQTNEQVLGVAQDTTQVLEDVQARDITQQQDTTKVKAENVETVVNNDNSLWLIIVAIVGWLAPSPGEIGRTVRGWFKKSS